MQGNEINNHIKLELLNLLEIQDAISVSLLILRALSEEIEKLSEDEIPELLETASSISPRILPLQSALRTISTDPFLLPSIVKLFESDLVRFSGTSLDDIGEKFLLLGCPSVSAKVLENTKSQVRLIEPPGLDENLRTIFRHRTKEFLVDSKRALTDINTVEDAIKWCDVIIVDTYGIGYSVYARKGALATCSLAYKKKPIILLATAHQFSSAPLVFHGNPLSIKFFSHILTEQGIHKMEDNWDDLSDFSIRDRRGYLPFSESIFQEEGNGISEWSNYYRYYRSVL